MTDIPQNLPAPPGWGVPVTDPTWTNWLYRVYAAVGQGPGLQVPGGKIGNATVTTEHAFQDLLSLDKGVYVNYASTVGNICYGFACNVHRSAGGDYVVGAQINSWLDCKGTKGIFGIVGQAINGPNLDSAPIVGFEQAIGSQTSAHASAKWGANIVFKDRGGASTLEGLGSNLFNYFAEAIVVTSQARSSAGEFCGWNCGIDFLDGSLDQSSVPAWSSTVTYSSGQIVSSGGVLWKAMQPSTNQAPSGVSAYWIQHTATGTTNLAVGIDFSSMTTTTIARVASAIRLRSSMRIDWNETGAIGTTFDANNAQLNLCMNQTAVRAFVKVATGVYGSSQAVIAPGGGSVAANPTIAGSGPSTIASKGWVQFMFNGATYFIPVWQ